MYGTCSYEVFTIILLRINKNYYKIKFVTKKHLLLLHKFSYFFHNYLVNKLLIGSKT